MGSLSKQTKQIGWLILYSYDGSSFYVGGCIVIILRSPFVHLYKNSYYRKTWYCTIILLLSCCQTGCGSLFSVHQKYSDTFEG